MNNPLASLSTSFTVFMLVVYLLLAAALLFTSWPQDLPKSNRYILAAALVLYSGYRGYRIIQKSKSNP